MKKAIKQTTSILLIAVLVLSVFAGLTFTSNVEADAASYPTGYPNTYKNTGIGAKDIVGVARTQIGYKENSAGTKYGYWYNTYFVDQPWCAMFVSWCANQAKIPQSVVTKFAACSVGISWFKSQKRWYNSKYFGGTYTPKKGDIVFYSDSGCQSDPSHVGLVAGLNGNYLDVIEGNATNSSVCEYTTSSSRSLNSSYVIGYGHPNYSTTATSEPKTHEVWQVCVNSLNMRKTSSTSSAILTKIPYGKEVKVTKFEVKSDYIWGYTTYNSKSGWIALNYCDYIYGNINGVYYQLKPKLSPTSTSIYVGYTKTLTKTNGLGGTMTSSNKAVATVNSAGKITAVKAGTATITIKTTTGSATCKVTVKNPTMSTKSTACIGDSVTLSVKNTKLTPTWSSTDSSIAKVTSKGKVTGVKEGEATIKAKVGDVTLSCKFTVTKYPTTYQNFTTKKVTYLKKTSTNLTNVIKIPKNTPIKVSKVYYSSTITLGYTKYSGKTGWAVLNDCKYNNGSIGGKTYYVRPYLSAKSKTIYLHKEYSIKVIDPGTQTSYTSSDTKIAKVAANGTVKGLKKGTATITVKSGSTKLTFKLTVKNPVLSASKASLVKGEKKKLTITGGSGTVTWSTGNSKIATVDKNGNITAKAYGTVTIKAVRNGITMSCKLSVYDPKLNITHRYINVKENVTLKVAQTNVAASKIKWSSADSKIAKVSSKGVVTGVKLGTTTISAKVGNVTVKCKFIVTKDPTTYQNFTTKKEIYLKKSSTDLTNVIKIPKNTALRVTKVYYSSTVTLGYTKYSGKTGWVVLNDCTYNNGSIKGKIYYVKPYLSAKTKTIYLHNEYTIKVYSPGSKTTYTSADPKIAAVTDKGKVTGVKAGTTTITVKSGSTKLTLKVTVKNPAFSSAKVLILKGNKKTLTLNGGSGTITWSSSDTKIVEVNKDGEITAKAYGTATIKAVRNGITVSCQICVLDPKLNATSKTIKVKGTVTLEVLQAFNAAVKWTTTDSKIAQVSTKGVVTGIKKGSVTITATVDGVALKCKITVQ